MGDKKAKQNILVGAIDFGTTYSGWAFSFLNEFECDPTIAHVKIWTNAHGSPIPEKTPTSLLIKPDGKTFDSFGYDAENKYARLTEEGEHGKYYFFRRFKMLLYRKLDETFDPSIEVKDETGKCLLALDIFAMAIKYLAEDMISNVKYLFDKNDINWVLTVPAIRNESAELFMITAAMKAGIQSSNLSVLLESEAGSVYCRQLPVEKTAVKVSQFKAGTKYVIVDAGGGTIDIAVHEVQKSGGIKEIETPTGGGCGAILVDKAFEDMLIEILSKEVYDKFKEEQTEDWFHVWSVFEQKKCHFDPDKHSEVTIRIPLSLDQTHKAIRKIGFEEAILASKFSTDMSLKKDKWRFSPSLFESFFQASTMETIKLVKEAVSMTAINTVLMVGGYSESLILQHAITTAMPDVTTVIPKGASSSILRGALIYGHRPSIITARKKKSNVFSLHDVSTEISQHLQDQSDMDKNLFYYTCKRLIEESKRKKLKSVEVCIMFTTGAVSVKSDKSPKNCFTATHDGQGGFFADWERENKSRIAYRVVVQSVDEFLSWIGDVARAAASGAGAAVKA